MRRFLAEHIQFIGIVASWVVVASFLGPVLYLWLPASLLLLRAREHWPELLMGFLVVLVLSDVHKDIAAMAGFKTVKNACIVMLTGFLILSRDRFVPIGGVFVIFLPFFIYSIVPLIFSNSLGISLQKTLSYALIFLVVPNYVLLCFREFGWGFFRNLMFVITAILVFGLAWRYVDPELVQLMGRFRGLFGNPNGLGIFCVLGVMLMGSLVGVKRDLFSWLERLIIYGVIIFCLIRCGSRASLVAVMIYFTIVRFFSYSPFLGFLVLVAAIGVIEVVSSNLGAIILALGLEEYFRLHTLEEGSGRYFAWSFAWEKVQEYLVFGGGFGTDEYVMRQNYAYLERMGHQGGVHNSYLSLWFDVGLIGLVIYFRSFVLVFVKAAKFSGGAMAVLFATLFSITYESWLVGSLNPFTILLLIIMTVLSEEEIALGGGATDVREETDAGEGGEREDGGDDGRVMGTLPAPGASGLPA